MVRGESEVTPPPGIPARSGVLVRQARIFFAICCISSAVAWKRAPKEYVGSCQESAVTPTDRHFRVSAPIFLQGVPSESELSRLPSCLGMDACQLLASPLEDCAESGQGYAATCNTVYTCGNASTIVHPEVYAAVIESGCQPVSDKSVTGTVSCGDTVMNNEIVAMVVGGACTETCRPQLGNSHAADKDNPCKATQLELRTENLLLALQLQSALQSPTVLQLLDTCLWSGGDVTRSVQAVGSTEVDQVIGEAGEGTLAASPWGLCSASCGKGWQERSLVCATAPAFLGELWECTNPMNATVSRRCGEANCDGVQLVSQIGPRCNATCGGGFANQTVTCKDMGYGQQSCASLGPIPPLEIPCNTYSCDLFVWHVGNWSSCSATCDGGIMERTTMCIDSTFTPVAASLCKGPAPVTKAVCNPNPCLGHCLKPGCSDCAAGFVGNYCEVPDSCVSDVVSTDGACCTSAVVDLNGACCPQNSVLDATGQCCGRGQVDPCGVCGGDGKLVDVQGACCTSGIVDARGVCCPGGMVDECGVCGGLSTSCALHLRMHADLFGYPFSAKNPPNATAQVKYRRQLKRGIMELLGSTAVNLKLGPMQTLDKGSRGTRITGSVLLAPSSVRGDDGLALTAAAARRLEAISGKEWKAGPGETYVLHLAYAGRTGMCGNGICEVGERSVVGGRAGTCEADCPVPYAPCPTGGSEVDATICTGAGRCLSNVGFCDCFAGYAGVACEQCAPGFIPSAGICIPYTPFLMMGTLHIPAYPPSYPMLPAVAAPFPSDPTPKPRGQSLAQSSVLPLLSSTVTTSEPQLPESWQEFASMLGNTSTSEPLLFGMDRVAGQVRPQPPVADAPTPTQAAPAAGPTAAAPKENHPSSRRGAGHRARRQAAHAPAEGVPAPAPEPESPNKNFWSRVKRQPTQAPRAVPASKDQEGKTGVVGAVGAPATLELYTSYAEKRSAKKPKKLAMAPAPAPVTPGPSPSEMAIASGRVARRPQNPDEIPMLDMASVAANPIPMWAAVSFDGEDPTIIGAPEPNLRIDLAVESAQVGTLASVPNPMWAAITAGPDDSLDQVGTQIDLGAPAPGKEATAASTSDSTASAAAPEDGSAYNGSPGESRRASSVDMPQGPESGQAPLAVEDSSFGPSADVSQSPGPREAPVLVDGPSIAPSGDAVQGPESVNEWPFAPSADMHQSPKPREAPVVVDKPSTAPSVDLAQGPVSGEAPAMVDKPSSAGAPDEATDARVPAALHEPTPVPAAAQQEVPQQITNVASRAPASHGQVATGGGLTLSLVPARTPPLPDALATLETEMDRVVNGFKQDDFASEDGGGPFEGGRPFEGTPLERFKPPTDGQAESDQPKEAPASKVPRTPQSWRPFWPLPTNSSNEIPVEKAEPTDPQIWAQTRSDLPAFRSPSDPWAAASILLRGSSSKSRSASLISGAPLPAEQEAHPGEGSPTGSPAFSSLGKSVNDQAFRAAAAGLAKIVNPTTRGAGAPTGPDLPGGTSLKQDSAASGGMKGPAAAIQGATAPTGPGLPWWTPPGQDEMWKVAGANIAEQKDSGVTTEGAAAPSVPGLPWWTSPGQDEMWRVPGASFVVTANAPASAAPSGPGLPWWIAPGQDEQWRVQGAGSVPASAPTLLTPKGESATEQDEGFQAAASRLAGILNPRVPAPAGLSEAGPKHGGQPQETSTHDHESAHLGDVYLTAPSGNGKDSLADVAEAPALPAVAPATEPTVPSVQEAGLESRDATLPAAAPDGDVTHVRAAPTPLPGMVDKLLAAQVPASAPAAGEDVLGQGSGDVPAPALLLDADNVPLPVNTPADAPVGTSSQDVDAAPVGSQPENVGQKALPPGELARPGFPGDSLDGMALLVEGPAPSDGIAEARADGPGAPLLGPSQNGEPLANSGDLAPSPAAQDAPTFDTLASEARASQANGVQESPTQASDAATLHPPEVLGTGLAPITGSGSEDLPAERAGTPDAEPTMASAPETPSTDNHVPEASPAEAPHVEDFGNEGRGPAMLPSGAAAQDAFPADASAPVTLPAEAPNAVDVPVEAPASSPWESTSAADARMEGPATSPGEAPTAGNEPAEGPATLSGEAPTAGIEPAEGPATLSREAPTAGNEPAEGPATLSGEAPTVGIEPAEGPATLSREAPTAGNEPAEGPATISGEAPTAGNEPAEGPATLSGEAPTAGNEPAEGPATLSGGGPTAGNEPEEGPTTLSGEAPTAGNEPAEGPATLSGGAPTAGNEPAEVPATLPPEVPTARNPAEGPATPPAEDPTAGNAAAEGPAALPAEAPTAGKEPVQGPATLPAEAPNADAVPGPIPSQGPSAESLPLVLSAAPSGTPSDGSPTEAQALAGSPVVGELPAELPLGSVDPLDVPAAAPSMAEGPAEASPAGAPYASGPLADVLPSEAAPTGAPHASGPIAGVLPSEVAPAGAPYANGPLAELLPSDGAAPDSLLSDAFATDNNFTGAQAPSMTEAPVEDSPADSPSAMGPLAEVLPLEGVAPRSFLPEAPAPDGIIAAGALEKLPTGSLPDELSSTPEPHVSAPDMGLDGTYAAHMQHDAAGPAPSVNGAGNSAPTGGERTQGADWAGKLWRGVSEGLFPSFNFSSTPDQLHLTSSAHVNAPSAVPSTDELKLSAGADVNASRGVTAGWSAALGSGTPLRASAEVGLQGVKVSLGDPATPGAYGSISLGMENGTPLIHSYNPTPNIPFFGHPSGKPQSFATDGGAPEVGLTVSHMNQLLAQQELLRQIASAVGAKNVGGDVSMEPVTQSTFARALEVGMAVDAAWQARHPFGAAMAPDSYLPASFLQHPTAQSPGGNPMDASQAALPASAPAYTAAAATGGYGMREDYVTPSPQQLYSQSLPEGASLFISHLEQRPNSGRPHTIEGLVQTNEELLGKIAAAVGAAREQLVAPDVTVSTANAVIQRVAAALAVVPSAATPPTASSPATDGQEESDDEGLRNRVFTAALQSLTEGGKANVTAVQTNASHALVRPNHKVANMSQTTLLTSESDESDKALIAQRMFAAIQPGSQGPAPQKVLTRDAAQDTETVVSQDNITRQGLLGTNPTPAAESLQDSITSSLLAALGPAINSEGSAASAPTTLGGSETASEAAAPLLVVAEPQQVGAGTAKAIVSPPKEKSVGKAVGATHKSTPEGNAVQSFLQDGTPEIPSGASQQKPGTLPPVAEAPIRGILPMLFDAISSLPALPAAPPAAVTAHLTLPNAIPTLTEASPVPSPLSAVSPTSQVSDGVPAPAAGPLSILWPEQSQILAPAPAQLEVAPTSSVVLYMELAGIGLEKFTEQQDQVVAAVAKAAGASPVNVKVYKASVRSKRRHLLQVAQTLAVEMRIMTNNPKVTMEALERNANALASELKQLGLSIVASSTAIGSHAPAPVDDTAMELVSTAPSSEGTWPAALLTSIAGTGAPANNVWAVAGPLFAPAPGPDAENQGFPAFAKQNIQEAKSASKNILEQASAWANNNPTTLLVIVLVGAAVFILILALAVFTCRRVRTRRQARVAEVARQIDSPDPMARTTDGVSAASISMHVAAGNAAVARILSEEARPSPLGLRTKFHRRTSTGTTLAPTTTAGGELPPSVDVPGADGSNVRTSSAGVAVAGSSSIRTSTSGGTSEPLAHYSSMDGGIPRSLSDTDSMPAKLPAFIPRSMFVAPGPELAGAGRPQLSESPVLHEAGAKASALPVVPAQSEQEELGPISNTNLIGVSSAFYSRMLAKSERVLAASQGALQDAKQVAPVPASRSMFLARTAACLNTEESIITTSGYPTTSSSDPTRTSDESVQQRHCDSPAVVPPASQAEAASPLPPGTARQRSMSEGGTNHGSVETPERVSVRDLLHQTEARLAAFRQEIPASPEIMPQPSFSPLATMSLSYMNAEMGRPGPPGGTQNRVRRALFVGDTEPTSRMPTPPASYHMGENLGRTTSIPRYGRAETPIGPTGSISPRTVEAGRSWEEDGQFEDDEDESGVGHDGKPTAAARLRLAADALALHISPRPESAVEPGPSPRTHRDRDSADASFFPKATGSMIGDNLEFGHESKWERAAQDGQRAHGRIPAYRPDKVLLMSPGGRTGGHGRGRIDEDSGSDLEDKGTRSEPGHYSQRCQVTMMHQYTSETVEQWLNTTQAVHRDDIDCRWLPPPDY